ncbi:MAG: dynamin family protein, partial [Ruminococcus sp.]|nr:dynamin family protein [Ruminococcus sp.]
MARLKIISNPYEEIISISQFDSSTSEWELVDYENSKLHSEKIEKGVFPFVVKKIADTIFEEFQAGSEPITIVFEGTDDELKELQEVCSDESYRGLINVEASSVTIRNARDILPEVKEIFGKMEPLINISVNDNAEVNDAKKRFADVSKEAIPICVFGNYSSGKSTFINSLVGYEVLPSGDDPLTAKIHRIERSAFNDRASISFEYEEKKIEILFNENGSPSVNIRIDDDFFRKLGQVMEESSDEPMMHRVYKVLEVLNDAENEEITKGLSDIISLKVPFNPAGVLGRSMHKIVIFDTPGANSASNQKHFDVLRHAMENLSNGLPVFVSEYDELDTKDSKNLCDTIKSMYRLDRRYTIIVVNKADQINFGKKPMDTGRVLNHTIPKNLEVNRIFFVSSVMGLGSKNSGNFLNEYYEEIFSDLEEKFSDPSSKFYKQLYKYDIMPEQLKNRSVERSDECENNIYANSGLYSIEEEIETFAGKYSPYNKCHQSKLFLDIVTKVTEQAITNEKQLCMEEKADLEQRLDAGEKKLVEDLDNGSKAIREQFVDEHVVLMKTSTEENITLLDKDLLQNREAEITEKIRSERTVTDSASNITDTPETKKGKLAGLFSDVKGSIDKAKEQRDNERAIDKEAADRILEEIKGGFTEYNSEAQDKLNEISQHYWTDCSDKMKKRLIEIVTGSDAISEERRSEIEEIIMTYAPVNFDRLADEVFTKTDFEHRSLTLFGVKLIENNKLNLGKLAKVFNAEHTKVLDETAESIKESHSRSFKD